MKQLFLCVVICFSFTSCKSECTHDTIPKNPIEELHFLRRSELIESNKYLSRSFIICSKYKKAKRDTLISQFVQQQLLLCKEDYSQINFYFYKESSYTNPKHLQEHPRDLDRYSQNNDFIWEYNWLQKGNLLLSYQYKKGKIVNPSSTIKVEDIN